MHRLQVLSRQFTAALESTDAQKLSKFISHDNYEMRKAVWEFLKNPIYRPNYDLSLAEFRELTLQRIVTFARAGFFSIRNYTDNPRQFMAALECLAYADFSMAIKSGVHFTLCGGTLCRLGTEKHHEIYLDKIDSLELPGSYCMTELGHGSNVMGVETTATYDEMTQEFVINTPTNTASKYWIGGGGLHAKITIMFAQLYVKNDYKGLHAFVMRIRDDNMQPVRGVVIKDIGHKMGLNGIDNGQLWFDHVRIPRHALLDRFASVSEDGMYSSPVPSVAKRFGIMVGGLTTGRVLIAQGCIDAMKMGLTIAIRYSVDRPQFRDKPIMEYITQQRNLFLPLAEVYALHIAMGELKRVIDDSHMSGLTPVHQEHLDKRVHVMSSGLKAMASWACIDTLNKCREACGGMGFHSANKIPELLKDSHITTTFEGSNPVLMQQVAKHLLEEQHKQQPSTFNHSHMTLFKNNSPMPNIQHIMDLIKLREWLLIKSLMIERDPFFTHLDIVMELAEAHVDRICLEAFMNELQKDNAPTQLAAVITLYAMSKIEKHMAFYLANRLILPESYRNITQIINTLCNEMAAQGGKSALLLCDAFEIPPHLLQAPIAFNWRTMGMST